MGEENPPEQSSEISQNQTPEPPPEPKPFFKFTKPIIIGLIAVILLAIAATVSYFVLSSNQRKTISPPEPIATPTPDPAANWKTYENTEYGFSFKYPENFIVKESDDSGVFEVDLWKEKEDSPLLFVVLFGKSGLEYKDFQEIISTSKRQLNPGYTYSNIIRKPIDGKEFYSYQAGVYINEGGYVVGPSAWLSAGGLVGIYFFEISSFELTKNQSLFDQILSTFKFTNPIITCIPRPVCLDIEPRCLLPETPEMCPRDNQLN